MRIEKIDFPIVVGSGVAGSSVALALPSALLLTRGKVASDGSSFWAQGGVAVALPKDDSPSDHAHDTIAASGGIADNKAVKILTEGGPDAVQKLIEYGVEFDANKNGDLKFRLEAGHSRRRILHSNGDATGKEVMRTLKASVLASDTISLREEHVVIDLVSEDGKVVGVVAENIDGERYILLAPAVVLATGGVGRVYARTTNPEYVNGGGMALAARAGAKMADLEFIQFHPTVLDIGLDPMPLLTEALRGEGATLVDNKGYRFMLDHHPDAELAPRDIVARSIWWQNQKKEGANLDARLIGEDFPLKFPTAFAYAKAAGIDPRQSIMPVSPAAHYSMSGIAVDKGGRSSIPGLYAIGEVSSTGIHGANRLASNSLLEGLVYGAIVAQAIQGDPKIKSENPKIPLRSDILSLECSPLLEDLRNKMWEKIGVSRSKKSIKSMLEWLNASEVLEDTFDGRNARKVATMISLAALKRTESRGGHYREDYPEMDPKQADRSFFIFEPVQCKVI